MFVGELLGLAVVMVIVLLAVWAIGWVIGIPGFSVRSTTLTAANLDEQIHRAEKDSAKWNKEWAEKNLKGDEKKRILAILEEHKRQK